MNGRVPQVNHPITFKLYFGLIKVLVALLLLVKRQIKEMAKGTRRMAKGKKRIANGKLQLLLYV